MRARLGILLLFLALPIASARAQADDVPSAEAPDSASTLPDSLRWYGPDELAVAVDSLSLAPGQKRVALSYSRVLEVRSVVIDGLALVPGQDLRVLAERGMLVLLRPAEGGETCVVRYRFDPIALTPQVVLNEPEIGGRGDEEEPSAEPVRPPEPIGGLGGTPLGNLRIQGAKTVSIQGGTNRDATVDQGLNLSVSGQLTEGIGVRAEISDENLPITPEGNTEELSDLDEIRIELFGERGRALLGDFRVDRPLGRFVPYERKLQGLWLEGRTRRGRLGVLGGAPQGRRREIEIRGREGVQGPYELLDGLRLEQSFIVAGSERVFVDGELQTRGEDRDYVIDYVRGTLTFTETRPIGPENRIAVDFESSVTGYRRSVLSALGDSLRLGDLRLDVALLREGDDPERPLDGSLGEEERAALAAAGDDPGLALASGVRQTVPGEGDYVRRTSDEGRVFYEAADSTGGDFDVDFLFVGEGEGSYTLEGVSESGILDFEYVGDGNGDYAVGRQLQLPEQTEVAVLRAQWGRQKTGALLSAEVDFTRHDRNRLSDLDDDDNDGTAWIVEGRTPRLFGDDEGNGLQLRALAEHLGADFHALGRLRDPFFYDDWNLQEDARRSDENRQELRAVAQGAERRAGLSYQRLEREDEYRGRRLVTDGGGELLGPVGWNHHLAETRSTRQADDRSYRRDRRLRLRLEPWPVIPFLERRDEVFTDLRGSRWVGYRSEGWAAGVTGRRGGRLEWSRDVADSLSASGQRWAFARDVRRVRWIDSRQWGNSQLSTDLSWRRTLLPGGLDETTRLARIQAGYRDDDRGFEADVEYRAGTDQSRVLGRQIVFVGFGEGDYDAEGNPVGVQQGDYNVVFTPSDSLVSSVEVEADLRLALRRDTAWLGGFESETLLQVRERSRTDDVGGLLRLDPDLLRQSDTTLFGQQRLREDLRLLRRRRGIDLRLVYDSTDVLDQRFTQGPEETRRRQALSRLDVEVAPGWTVGAEASDEIRSRVSTSDLNPQLRSYDVADRSGAVTLRFRPSPRQRLALELRWTDRDETRQDIQQRLLELRPAVGTDWWGASWTLDARWVEVTEEAPPDPQRPFFFERPGTGRSAGLRVQWGASGGLSVALRYQVRDEPQRELRHDLGLETRARF